MLMNCPNTECKTKECACFKLHRLSKRCRRGERDCCPACIEAANQDYKLFRNAHSHRKVPAVVIKRKEMR
jgi:hypothetical protein